MSVALGFGSIESQYEQITEKRFRDYVTEEFAKESESYFSSEFVEKVIKWARWISEESRKEADGYKNAAVYPDRYSSFHCYVLGDANYIVFIVKFHHINRRHPMSHDGWGMLQSRWIFDVDLLGIELERKTQGDHK